MMIIIMTIVINKEYDKLFATIYENMWKESWRDAIDVRYTVVGISMVFDLRWARLIIDDDLILDAYVSKP